MKKKYFILSRLSLSFFSCYGIRASNLLLMSSFSFFFPLHMAVPQPIIARAEDLPSSTYYIHANENPSLILVSPLLTASNYHSWSRSMLMAVLSKHKLMFIDDNTPNPQRTDPIYPVWERCNNLVHSLILKSLSPSIAQSNLWFDFAKDVSRILKVRLSQGDYFWIADLQEQYTPCKKGSYSITDYFTRFKTLWDELVSMRPTPQCVCEPLCICGADKKGLQYQQTIKLYVFGGAK